MACPISVSDIVNIANSAWDVSLPGDVCVLKKQPYTKICPIQIYQKVKTIPDDYAALAHHVHILHNILTDTKAFFEEGNIPNSATRTASLQNAAEGCRTTLAEVDEFLLKYARLGRSQKRLVDIVKFIYSDREALEKKLQHNSRLLQLALISLNT